MENMKHVLIKKIQTAFLYIQSFLKWTGIALMTGVLGGFIGAVFRVSIEAATSIREETPALIFFLPFGGIIIVAIYKLCGMLNHKGTDGVFDSLHSDDGVSFLLAPAIFIGTVITHLFGGSAGREGAALQLGGSIGSQVGRVLRLDENSMHLVIMCGMSSVFAALFGTPVTAAFFALGVTSVGTMYYPGIIPCLVSSIAAFAITQIFNIAPTHFVLSFVPGLSIGSLLKVSLIAALCAGLSVVFCITLHQTGRGLKKLFKNPYLRIIAGSFAIIMLTYVSGGTDYNGAGGDIISNAISGNAKPEAFLFKIIFTAITLGAGFKGGEIVPTFFIGSTFGCTVAGLIGFDPGFGAAIGLIATFCGVVNCPIASLFLSIELFGSEGIILFAAAVGISYVLSGYYSLYGSQRILYSKYKAKYINVYTK